MFRGDRVRLGSSTTGSVFICLRRGLSLRDNERVLRSESFEDAYARMRRFGMDAAAAQKILRRLHLSPSPEDALHALARLLVRGNLVLLESRRVVSAPMIGKSPEQTHDEPSLPEREWIRFLVVDHHSGLPMENVELKITLPDDAVHEAKTGPDGIIEIPDVPTGVCSVESSFDLTEREACLELIAEGRLPTDPESPDTTGNPPQDSSPSTYRIVLARSYALREGESLQDVAATVGLSYEELAEYNFGTTDADEVEEALLSVEAISDEVIAALEGDGGEEGLLVFGESPNPDQEELPTEFESPSRVFREIRIPSPFERTGCQTGFTHVLRVDGPEDETTYLSLILFDDAWTAPLAEVPYEVASLDGAVMFTGTTDDEGALEHPEVPLGYYRLTVQNVLLEAQAADDVGTPRGDVSLNVPSVSAYFRRHHQRVPRAGAADELEFRPRRLADDTSAV